MAQPDKRHSTVLFGNVMIMVHIREKMLAVAYLGGEGHYATGLPLGHGRKDKTPYNLS